MTATATRDRDLVCGPQLRPCSALTRAGRRPPSMTTRRPWAQPLPAWVSPVRSALRVQTIAPEKMSARPIHTDPARETKDSAVGATAARKHGFHAQPAVGPVSRERQLRSSLSNFGNTGATFKRTWRANRRRLLDSASNSGGCALADGTEVNGCQAHCDRCQVCAAAFTASSALSASSCRGWWRSWYL